VEKKQLSLAGVAASLGGMGVGIYGGMSLLIPAAAAGAVWYVGSKVLKPRNEHYLSPAAFLSGHLIWLLVGTALLGAWQANSADIVIMLVGAVWLWLRPGLFPVAALTIFEFVALAVNGAAIVDQVVGSPTHRALVVHIVLRCATVFLMWRAYLRSKHEASAV
jgi:hypothetical protein